MCATGLLDHNPQHCVHAFTRCWGARRPWKPQMDEAAHVITKQQDRAWRNTGDRRKSFFAVLLTMPPCSQPIHQNLGITNGRTCRGSKDAAYTVKEPPGYHTWKP